jgi:hypothetical protein
MARRVRWQPGAVVAARLRDGRVYAGRLLEFPWVAFYAGSDDQPPGQPADVTGRPVLRTLAVHDGLLDEGWSVVGVAPLDESLRPPPQFIQDLFDPADLQVVDAAGHSRPATPDEVRGLERAAVWAPEHVEDMLVAHARGEVDPQTRALAYVEPRTDTGNDTQNRSAP